MRSRARRDSLARTRFHRPSLAERRGRGVRPSAQPATSRSSRRRTAGSSGRRRSERHGRVGQVGRVGLRGPADLARRGGSRAVRRRTWACSSRRDEALRHLRATPRRRDTADKPLVVQYEVTLTRELTCARAYIKVLESRRSRLLNARPRRRTTPYVHVRARQVRRHEQGALHLPPQEPGLGRVGGAPQESAQAQDGREAAHIPRRRPALERVRDPHRQQAAASGSLLEDFEPAVNPPKESTTPTTRSPRTGSTSRRSTTRRASSPTRDEDAPKRVPGAAAEKPRALAAGDEPGMASRRPRARAPPTGTTRGRRVGGARS